MTDTCDLEPFKYQSVPVPAMEAGASGNQINEQAIEDYLARLVRAVCADLQALEARVTALETPP